MLCRLSNWIFISHANQGGKNYYYYSSVLAVGEAKTKWGLLDGVEGETVGQLGNGHASEMNKWVET